MTDPIADAEFEYVEVASIIIGERARPLNLDKVNQLADSLRDTELMQPITIWRGPNGPTLIAGAHRLAAFKKLGRALIAAKWSSVNDSVAARSLERIENLIRYELSALDRAHHLFKWKQDYEAEHPETRQGAQGGRGGNKNENGAVPFSKYAGNILGLEITTITKAVAIWKKLKPDTVAAIQGTWLADHNAGLMQLSKQTPAIQNQVVKALFPVTGKARATTVPDALTIIAQGRVLTSIEKRFAGINKALRELADEELDAVLTVNEERVIAWAKHRINEKD